VAVDDLEEVGAVEEQPIVISESSAVVLEAALVEDMAEPLPLRMAVDSEALPQLLLTEALLLMAGPVAMAAEAMAIHPAVVANLGGRLPLVDGPLFLFRYVFDPGTIHRFGTKASTDIFRTSSADTNSFSSGFAVSRNLLTNCIAFLGFLVFAAHFFDFLVATHLTRFQLALDLLLHYRGPA